ncbi:hypothetical protein PUNSTDRAFT_49389 [Punctularia strigosozonata HHB-11173 SS5]|uniref:uncharacterized protein n=1 Tax=Punctularia strigosozonata (strain HHB-11173) TaxID=741275 RepID=UPI0004417E7B|nr:uncharacterized protein PUNSTDRAFT_49389 [Punctularia strigosozonata HHB-11173 SS5]EIN14689.1 hypothetical protein PUNSTDRAFT_49389 [Punctularia strigosozonata HHB-11173 SS5]
MGSPQQPTTRQQRRMTVPAPPPQSLDLPEAVYGHPGHSSNNSRPPSPLRNGVSADDLRRQHDEDDESEDGSDQDEDDDVHRHWGQRAQSPTPSMSQLAATFAQRLNTAVTGRISSPSPSPMAAPGSPSRKLTDAELEAEAERERDRSRREAERIMLLEAEERRLVEERVRQMMESGRRSPIANGSSLPPPPTRSQSTPNPPSPASSDKGVGGWWNAAKQRLTPTKEPLTPAQQIIQETKQRDKERKKAEKAERKSKSRERGRSTSRTPDPEWPAKPDTKREDPAFLRLAESASPPSTPPRGPGISESPTTRSAPSRVPAPQFNPPPAVSDAPVSSSLTPPRPQFSSQAQPPQSNSLPPSLFGSPSRNSESSPRADKEQPPLYAQFDQRGTLDVHGTLLVVAKRFEKLEKWTVGHVRALEERMSDVEKWLVDKEREKEEAEARESQLKEQQSREQDGASRENERDQDSVTNSFASNPSGSGNGERIEFLEHELGDLRDEMAELQGRIGEIGREMARLATLPGNLSNISSRDSIELGRAPSTASSLAVRSIDPKAVATPVRRVSTPSSSKFGDSTSPPARAHGVVRSGSRTRLPYPTGDYASPPESALGGAFSPPSSPPQTQSYGSTNRSNVSGLPSVTSDAFGKSPLSTGLPPPSAPALRSTSTSPNVSPTPRKRYTVALGGPLRPPEAERELPANQAPVATAYFSSSPAVTPTELDYTSASDADASGDDESVFNPTGAGRHKKARDAERAEEEDEFQEETIGKSLGRTLPIQLKHKASNGSFEPSPSPSPSSNLARGRTKPRPQSSYAGFSYSSVSSQSTTSLNSTGSASVAPLKVRLRSRSTAGSSDPKFVDPYEARKQEKEGMKGVKEEKAPKVAAGKPRPPVGQLVAFFDGGERKEV